MVIWIIGLSGSGKTYLAKKLIKKIKGKTILIDGDVVRKYITYDLRYSKKDREKNSIIISDLCRFLESQGFTVICSILSIFLKHQRRNRQIFEKYFQIYLKSNLSILKKRNNKKIYNKKNNVVGESSKFPIPIKNNMVIENNFKPYDTKILNKIIKNINEIKRNKKKN